MWKTFVRTTACLAVSATALIVVTRMDATAAAPRKASAPETEAAEPKPAPRTRKSGAPPKPAPAPTPKLTVASIATKSSFSEPPATTTAKSEDRATVTVPDWKGKRLSVVRREARKLGLNVTGVTGIGDTVPADEASSYRVRKQLTEAGAEVDPGTDVQLRVRMIVDTAEGY